VFLASVNHLAYFNQSKQDKSDSKEKKATVPSKAELSSNRGLGTSS